MISKNEVVKEAIDKLKSRGIPDYRLSSEYILAVALKKQHKDLLLVDNITEKEYKRYLKLIDVRCKHVPLDKIIGFTDFYDLKIPYNKNVLTPRNETELLAEIVINDVNKYKDNDIKVLDMCTGSGCLGLSIAKHTESKVTLSDISKKAISISLNIVS